MPTVLTEKEFSRHLNTTFHASFDPEREMDLELVEVKGYGGDDGYSESLERFSVFFAGPENITANQGIYRLRHDLMGEFEIFLVPVKHIGKLRYEAVFNYFKQNNHLGP
jgi:uncharacterized protein DUF6916